MNSVRIWRPVTLTRLLEMKVILQIPANVYSHSVMVTYQSNECHFINVHL